MITPICPKCNQKIAVEDINVAADVAYCRACNLASKLSELVNRTENEVAVDLQRPPAGCWYRHVGLDTRIGATHRSVGGALGTLALCLFWNGIVSVFVLCALSGALHRLGIPMPEWFPAPKMNGHIMSTGEVVFMWIFLTPFIVVGAGMVAAFLSYLFGRTELRISGKEAALFRGIGPVGWTTRFDPTEVKDVRIDLGKWSNRNGQRREVVVTELANGRKIEFGSALTDERRKFMGGALQENLRRKI